MEDLKEMGDQFELRLGNREVALLVGALFLVLVLVFALGVIMGKRLYGPVQGEPIAQVTPTLVETPVTSPAPTTAPATSPTPVATGEQYTFPETLRNLPATGSAPHAPSPIATSETPAATRTVTPPPRPAPRTEPVADPEPPSHAATPPTARSSGGAYSIQVSAVPDKKRAEDYMKTLKGKGFAAWISAVDGADGKTYYRVRIGHYATYEEGKAEMQTLIDAGSIPKDSFVRK